MKEKIQAEKGWDVALQKLIYSGMLSWLLLSCPRDGTLTRYLGKILQDANTVESYKIEEKGFIVCMISKVQLYPLSMAEHF